MAQVVWPSDTDLGFGANIANDAVIGTNDFFAFGRNESLANGAVSYLNINNGVHVPITTPTKIYIYSTNAGDVGKAVLIFGLDSDYKEQVLPFVLNGTTAVDVGDWGAIHGMRVIGETAVVGSIFASTATGSVLGDAAIQSIIDPIDQQAFNLYYRIPDNRVGYAYEFIFTDYRNGGSGNAVFFLETRSNGNLKTPWVRQAYAGLQVSGSNGFAFTLEVPLRLPSNTEVRIGATASNGGHSAAVGLQIILRDT